MHLELPNISIVTPSFNQGQYLDATIQSVLDQSYPKCEYIVMDGGSTDGSVEIIQRYEGRLAYWESGPDKGQADAIYRGFLRSTGEIIGWVNSDDLLLPGSLEMVGRWFAANPREAWVVGDSIYINEHGRPIGRALGLPRINSGQRSSFRQLLYGGCPFTQPASFWRREVFFDIGGFDQSLQFCFDYDMYLRLAMRKPSGVLNRYLACFRVHPASKSSTIQHVRQAEDETLWRRYGRAKAGRWTCAMWSAIFTLRRKIYSSAAYIRLYVTGGRLPYSP